MRSTIRMYRFTRPRPKLDSHPLLSVYPPLQPEKLSSCIAWCEAKGWQSVGHLRLGGGAHAVEELTQALHLKSGGNKARRLTREIMKDVWSWDAHACAAAFDPFVGVGSPG